MRCLLHLLSRSNYHLLVTLLATFQAWVTPCRCEWLTLEGSEDLGLMSICRGFTPKYESVMCAQEQQAEKTSRGMVCFNNWTIATPRYGWVRHCSYEDYLGNTAETCTLACTLLCTYKTCTWLEWGYGSLCIQPTVLLDYQQKCQQVSNYSKNYTNVYD